MRVLKIVAVATLALVAVACSKPVSGALAPVKTDIKALEARLDAIPTEKFVLKADGPTDIAALVAAAPAGVKITYATVTFDAPSGATLINQLRITPTDAPDIGVTIDQLKVWGLDAKAASDRFAGLNLDKTVQLARRVEATGVTTFGLDKAIAPAMASYMHAVTGWASDMATTGMEAESPEAQAARETIATEVGGMNLSITDYSASAERIILDDLYLRPWEMTPAALPADNAWSDVMPTVQTYAAVSRSFAVDFAVILNMKTAFAMSTSETTLQPATSAVSAYVVPATAYRGWRGGDIDLGVMRSMDIDMDQTGPGMTMQIRETVERVTLEQIRSDRLLGFVARGVMPPRTETDILSLGVMTFDKLAASFGGGSSTIFSVGKMKLNLSKFHWLIPSQGRVEVDDLVYDIPALMDYAQAATASLEPVSADADASAPPSLIDPAILAVLVKYGLDKPSIDFDLGWSWDPKSGATRADMAFGLDGYMRWDQTADMILPAFAPVSDLLPENGEAEFDAVADLFGKVVALKSASLNLVDEGGLEKGFALAVDLGKALPPSDPSTSFLRNTTPENLRGIASNGAYLLADQAAATLPALKDMLRPFATWVTSGGAVHATAKPKAPIVFSEYGRQVDAGEIAPAAALDAFNIKVTHETPKAVKKPN